MSLLMVAAVAGCARWGAEIETASDQPRFYYHLLQPSPAATLGPDDAEWAFLGASLDESRRFLDEELVCVVTLRPVPRGHPALTAEDTTDAWDVLVFGRWEPIDMIEAALLASYCAQP